MKTYRSRIESSKEPKYLLEAEAEIEKEKKQLNLIIFVCRFVEVFLLRQMNGSSVQMKTTGIRSWIYPAETGIWGSNATSSSRS